MQKGVPHGLNELILDVVINHTRATDTHNVSNSLQTTTVRFWPGPALKFISNVTLPFCCRFLQGAIRISSCYIIKQVQRTIIVVPPISCFSTLSWSLARVQLVPPQIFQGFMRILLAGYDVTNACHPKILEGKWVMI